METGWKYFCGTESIRVNSCALVVFIWFLLFLVGVAFASVPGTNEGDEVVVVYNSRVPESKGVAEYYAQKRMVPSSQIFGFALTTNEDISRTEFRDELRR